MDFFKISSSVLPTAHDCMRRAAAKRFGDRIGDKSRFGRILEQKGFIFDHQGGKKTLAAPVGTAIHKIVETAHADRLAQIYSKKRALESGIDSLYEHGQDAGGDDTTPTIKHAENQVKVIGSFVLDAILPRLNIHSIEQHFTAMFSGDIMISGHIDLITLDEFELPRPDDWKFGLNGDGYGAQIGSYGSLMKSNGFEELSKESKIHHIPRGKGSTPKYNEITLNTGDCESLAYATTKHISRAIKDFERTGDPDVFIANPASKLCSNKFCPAWGTDFCTYHNKKGA